MIRTIVGFHLDADGDWVADLSCWHRQHVRHRPPFHERSWVLDPAGRAARVGSAIACPLCDRAELPDGLIVVGHAGPWDEASLPEALRRAHRTPPGRWGYLQVHGGTVDFQFLPDDTPPSPVLHLPGGSHQPIPPGLAHRVIPVGPVHLELEFLGRQSGDALRVSARTRSTGPDTEAGHQPGGSATITMPRVPDEGGDPACWAGLICAECGAVLDGGPHRPGCPTVGHR